MNACARGHDPCEFALIAIVQRKRMARMPTNCSARHAHQCATGVPTSCSRGDASGVEAPRGGTGRVVSKGLPAATAAPVPAAAASVKALKRPRVEADSEIAHPNLAPLFTVFIYGVCVVRT